MPGAVSFLANLKEMGYKVIIHTTGPYPRVWDWLIKYQLHPFISGITNTKVPAVAYIDGRAVCFRGSFSDALADLQGFKPWWKNTCSNYGHQKDGVCHECAGENYGHATEVTPLARCSNWRSE